MPNIVQGNPTSRESRADLRSVSYDYTYDEGLDLKPGSKQHDRIRDLVLDRADVGARVISRRVDSWRETDRLLTAYVQPTADDLEALEKDPNKPVTIVFPYTYAMLETLLTYMVEAFFSEPVFVYEGRSPEDVVGAKLLEMAIQYQLQRTKALLSLHTFFRDMLAYGIGATSPVWEQEVVQRYRRVKQTQLDLVGGEFETEGRELVKVWYEGNRLYNVDPYRMLIDPKVTPATFQRSEFFGWVDTDSYMSMLRQERGGQWFNVRYLKHLKDRRSAYAIDNSGRETRFGGKSDELTPNDDRVDLIWMYCWIIPEDEGLGDGEYPELWLFCLAADEVVVRAERVELIHGKIPVAIASPEFDGYSAVPLSRLEIAHGLQRVLDFLFNSHIYNVKKAVNDMLVVDPYMVSVADLKDPKPGKIIRLRRPAWGRGVQDAVKQLTINDVTRNNIADSEWIVQWMQKTLGTDDPVMGALRRRGPERLTSTEFQGTRAGALSRLGRVARLVGVQAMYDLGEMLAVHTQQFMSQELFLRITGEYAQLLLEEHGVAPAGSKRLRITPADLSVDFDVVVRDGSVPGGADTQTLMKLFETIARDPELRQQFDLFRLFGRISREAGVKDYQDFRRRQTNIELRPNEEVLKQVERGNLVPMPTEGL